MKTLGTYKKIKFYLFPILIITFANFVDEGYVLIGVYLLVCMYVIL